MGLEPLDEEAVRNLAMVVKAQHGPKVGASSKVCGICNQASPCDARNLANAVLQSERRPFAPPLLVSCKRCGERFEVGDLRYHLCNLPH